MFYSDLHLHTDVSTDSDAPMPDVAERAVQKGMDLLCFTDHCDLICNDRPGVVKADHYPLWERSFAALERTRALWGDRIELLHGMELAEIVQAPEQAARCASTPGLDFIIGSVHALTGELDFYLLDYPDIDTCRDYTRRYLEENIRMAELNLTDVIGHIGYTNRYMSRNGFFVDLMDYEDLLRTLFHTLVDRGRGIEVNTSGLRQGQGETFPPLPVLKLYRACGGEIVTAGSDSHTVEDVGAGIREAQALLSEAGFTHMTVFRERKPEFIPLG